MPLAALPNELLLQVAGHLDVHSLHSLQLTNLHLSTLVSGLSYAFASADRGRLQALHWACTNGHLGLVELLLRNGTNVSAKATDMFSWEPLHYAVYSGHLPVVSLLLSHGAHIAAPDGEGSSPLHWATRRKMLPIALALLENGAPVNAQDNHGYTPLHLAALYEVGDDLIKLLLDRGADPSVQDYYRSTPLHRIVQSDVEEVNAVTWMLEKGADVHVRDKDGLTALHWVAKMGVAICKQGPQGLEGEGRSTVAKLLMARGADPNALDRDGKSVFNYAAECQLQDMFRSLTAVIKVTDDYVRNPWGPDIRRR